MVNIEFNCPECGQLLAIDPKYAGTNVQCPKCKVEVTVPEVNPTGEGEAKPTTKLSPEEKQKINEEEKVRVEAQDKAKKELEAKKTKEGWFGCLGCLGLIILIVVIFVILPATPSWRSPPINKKVSEKKINKQKQETVSNSPWNASVWQVASYLKDNLKDPKSFEAIEWSTVAKHDNGNFSVRCKYRAKNSFGGYVIENQIFTLDPKGNVIGVINF